MVLSMLLFKDRLPSNLVVKKALAENVRQLVHIPKAGGA